MSRPNWVHEKHKEGLDNFLTLLKSHELTPRTIGKTDFPSKSPMDEVIDLLYKCEGAIILGYPQIQINSGYVKEIEVHSLTLSTEWNHIEAGLARALGLPLLVIHDKDIRRGIFDRGVLNSFLYEKDFSDKAWSISKDIVGALTQWKTELKTINKPQENNNKEQPKMQWGCFIFDGDENLYCPFCYNNKSLRMQTTRINSKSRMCTSCGKTIPS